MKELNRREIEELNRKVLTDRTSEIVEGERESEREREREKEREREQHTYELNDIA